MENKPANAESGCLIQILPMDGVPNYHTISHCTFKNFPGAGGDYGNEPIRIGLGVLSNFPSRSIVEYCYFYNTGLADSESISIKSEENVIRHNVFDNNVGAMLVFRNGDRNIAYSNMFIRGSGGVRVKEANNILIFNNYFDGSESSIKNNAACFDFVEPNLKNINFIHNTFINGTVDFDVLLVNKADVSINFINNIFYKNDTGNLFFSSNKKANLKFTEAATFEGNLFDTSDATIVAEKSTLEEKSNLVGKKSEFVKMSDGSFSLSEKSAAINSASINIPVLLSIIGIDNYFNLERDINGNSRPTTKNMDIGAQ